MLHHNESLSSSLISLCRRHWQNKNISKYCSLFLATRFSYVVSLMPAPLTMTFLFRNTIIAISKWMIILIIENAGLLDRIIIRVLYYRIITFLSKTHHPLYQLMLEISSGAQYTASFIYSVKSGWKTIICFRAHIGVHLSIFAPSSVSSRMSFIVILRNFIAIYYFMAYRAG
jgi:hypothetical protein